MCDIVDMYEYHIICVQDQDMYVIRGRDIVHDWMSAVLHA